MPALIPVDNTLGALFIATVLSSMCVSSQAACNTLSQDLIGPDRHLVSMVLPGCKFIPTIMVTPQGMGGR